MNQLADTFSYSLMIFSVYFFIHLEHANFIESQRETCNSVSLT
jgi:hypothetical protein